MTTKIGTEAAARIKTNINVNLNNRKARKNGHLSVLGLRALLVLYIYTLVKIVLLKFHSLDPGFLWGRLQAGLKQPELLSQWLHTGNLVPFHEISRSLHSLSDHAIFNLFGNMAIFMPLGIILGLMFHNVGMGGLKIVVCAFIFSLGLESAQLLFMIGQFDVDDILLNSSGGLLGFVIYRTTISSFHLSSSRTRTNI
ncbi:glycopeptide antibiotics resistance protein [Paenibacillus endophyticus]|uniref:Glycopeptide antibiotics resistance protein n=1 Tax=Paenibacillus endophyticus TaxID=1294268 RepID=A0A7W5C8Y8_9BACL|nr:VanZ family protein [Paenibacillus endophyticus]MBB3153268.1 glycopeptide antibiotics resistance protein [Paenibacillus endophyticus]